jgi:hypothetical protein
MQGRDRHGPKWGLVPQAAQLPATEEAKYSQDMPARRKKLRVKIDCWANVHEDGSILVWPTKELAEEHPTRGTIACIHNQA